MGYRVQLTAHAEEDVAAVLRWFQEQRATAAGAAWFAQLLERITTLEDRPERCALASEAADLGMELREFLVGRRRHKYRVLFVIQGTVVQILRVRHSARDVLTGEDI